MFEDPRIVREIMDLGANAYVHRSASVEELFTALWATALDTEGKHTIIAMPKEALEPSEDDFGEDGSGSVLSI